MRTLCLGSNSAVLHLLVMSALQSLISRFTPIAGRKIWLWLTAINAPSNPDSAASSTSADVRSQADEPLAICFDLSESRSDEA
jgi:hypothetical protein